MGDDTTLTAAVRAELRSLKATTTPDGRLAVALAGRLDDSGARDAPALSRELRLVMADIRDANMSVKSDPVDELRGRRERRRHTG